MKKRMIICMAAAVMLIFSATAFAEEDAISYSQDGERVFVSGKIRPSMRTENITLIITRKGVNIAEEEFDSHESKNKLELVESLVTEADGSWHAVWYPSQITNYELKATVNASGESVKGEFYYVDEGRKDKINHVMQNGTRSELEELFSDRITLYVLGYSESETAKISDTAKVGRALWYIRKDIKDSAELFNEIPLAMDMAIFYETGDGFAEMTSTMERFGKIKNLGFYHAISDDEVKKQVGAYAAKGILESGLYGYDKLFTESVVLAGVEKSGSYTYLDKYLSLLDNQNYSNASQPEKENIQRALVGNSYTAETLAAAIRSALQGGKNDRPGSGGSGGGGYSTGVSKLDAVPPEAHSCADVAQTHWAFAAISGLYDRKITEGYQGNMFRPEAPLTRAETVTLLCRAFQIDILQEESAFEDVKEDDWYAPYVNAGYRKGLVFGDGACFQPNSNITRQDLCVMIYRFAQQDASDAECEFADNADIDSYANKAVGVMSKSGIVSGFEDHTFRPRENATRAQMAQILYKYLVTHGM